MRASRFPAWVTPAFADVLRLADRFDALASHPRTREYLQRAPRRPAFEKALADQLALYAE